MFRAFSVLCNSLFLLSVTIIKKKTRSDGARRAGSYSFYNTSGFACSQGQIRAVFQLTAIIRVLRIILRQQYKSFAFVSRCYNSDNKNSDNKKPFRISERFFACCIGFSRRGRPPRRELFRFARARLVRRFRTARRLPRARPRRRSAARRIRRQASRRLALSWRLSSRPHRA